MTLLFDQYLALASGKAEMGFAWDEWRIQEDYADSETGFEERLELLSDAANLALTIALGEWIATGLRSYDDPDRTVATMSSLPGPPFQSGSIRPISRPTTKSGADRGEEF